MESKLPEVFDFDHYLLWLEGPQVGLVLSKGNLPKRERVMPTRRTPAVEWVSPQGQEMSISVETRKDRWRLVLVCGGEFEETPWARHPGVHRLSDASILESAVVAAENHMRGKSTPEDPTESSLKGLSVGVSSLVLGFP